MIPRGEVGLIFAGMGLAGGVIGTDLYSALVAMVMVTTFVAPPWLKALYSRTYPDESPSRGSSPPGRRV